MAEPLVISFAADTSRAQSAMATLAAQIVGNMASIGTAMAGGAANANGFGGALGNLTANLSRAATAVGNDVTSIAGATARAATADKATLQSVVSAFTAAAVTSNTASAGVKAGVSATSTALGTLAAQLPILLYLGTGLGVAAAAYGTIAMAVAAANKQMDAFIALGAEAEKTGLGVGFLQRFKDVAKDAKIAVEEIDQALRHASRATTPRFEQDNPVQHQLTDIFESGYTGSFQSKGLSDYLGAKDADTRVRAVVTAMQELRDLGLSIAAIDLAEKVFGSAVAERIRSGRLEIDAIAEALDRKRDDLISQDEIDNATAFKDRLADAYDEIGKVLETSFTVIEAGKGINQIWLSIVETTAKAATHAGTFLDNMLKAARATDGQSPLYPRQRQEGEGSLGADLGADAARAGRGRTLYDSPIGPERPSGFIPDPPAPPRRPLSFFTERAPERPARQSGGDTAVADPVETFVHQLEKSAAAVKAEAEAFGKSNSEKQVAIQLARAQEIASQNGRTLTDAETASITRAATATATYRDRILDLEQAQRETAETARYFGDTIVNSLADAIFNGRKFSDILHSLEAQFSRAALQAILTGQGPLASFFGTAPPASAGPNAVGGLAGAFNESAEQLFRANGGPVEAGRAYTVGEMGRELFIPNQSGRMVPIERTVPGPAAPAEERRPVAVHVSVMTQDARSFLRSEGQVTAALARAVQRGTRGL